MMTAGSSRSSPISRSPLWSRPQSHLPRRPRWSPRRSNPISGRTVRSGARRVDAGPAAMAGRCADRHHAAALRVLQDRVSGCRCLGADCRRGLFGGRTGPASARDRWSAAPRSSSAVFIGSPKNRWPRCWVSKVRKIWSCLSPWLRLGDSVRSRRELRRQTRLRAEQARLEHEANARALVEQERLRIAREVHDVIAHSVSAISIQSVVGLEALPAEPENAATALRNIRQVSGAALAELRSAVGVLRDADGAARGRRICAWQSWPVGRSCVEQPRRATRLGQPRRLAPTSTGPSDGLADRPDAGRRVGRPGRVGGHRGRQRAAGDRRLGGRGRRRRADRIDGCRSWWTRPRTGLCRSPSPMSCGTRILTGPSSRSITGQRKSSCESAIPLADSSLRR